MNRRVRAHGARKPSLPRSSQSRDDGGVERVYGLRAGLAVLSKRPTDVLRIACSRESANAVEQALTGDSFAGRRPALSVLADHDLERFSRSSQHEGLCIETRPRRWLSPKELSDLLLKKDRTIPRTALALDRVRNSYNVGAILRSCAFFGVDAVLLGAPAPHPGLDPNAVRVAEGGAEHLSLSRTTDLADTLGRLRALGIKLYGADGHATTDALGFAFERPAILVLGNEREGLGPRIRAACDVLVAIRGEGAVESLNVATAAAILIARLTHTS